MLKYLSFQYNLNIFFICMYFLQGNITYVKFLIVIFRANLNECVARENATGCVKVNTKKSMWWFNVNKVY